MSTVGADRSRRNYIVPSQEVEKGTPKTQKEWKKAPGFLLSAFSPLSQSTPETTAQ